MHFELNDEERLIQETAAKFALRELRPQAAELDRTRDRSILLNNLKKLADLGFMGLNIRTPSICTSPPLPNTSTRSSTTDPLLLHVR